jgi:hypothetical protein
VKPTIVVCFTNSVTFARWATHVGCSTATLFCLYSETNVMYFLFNVLKIKSLYIFRAGYAVVQWLWHCATSRKFAGLISDGVTGIFYWHKPSGRTMTLGTTQPLTEISTRNISWGKGGRCVGLTTLPPSCADCLKIWEPQTPGNLRACQGL